MGGEVEVVVRRALVEDLPRRAELLRVAYPAPLWDAFLYFFFQELTLECCVLGAAVLFIFCGVSAFGAACVVPAAGLIVWVSVAVASYALAVEQAQKIRGEVVGLVAEARGALFAGPPPRIRVRIAPHSESVHSSPYSQIVGTVSVAALRGMHAAGWLHALAVHPHWRRRGVGRALEAAARGAARGAGRGALQAAVTELQPAARALLHAAGWELRGAYARPLCGAALALPVARLALAPHALDLA